MGEPRDGDEVDAVAAAAHRLERAVALLESQVKSLTDRAEGGTGGLFDLDRSQLASALDIARARERELEVAGQEASQALGHAIAGIRTALAQAEEV
jgi:hypothetical protein